LRNIILYILVKDLIVRLSNSENLHSLPELKFVLLEILHLLKKMNNTVYAITNLILLR